MTYVRFKNLKSMSSKIVMIALYSILDESTKLIFAFTSLFELFFTLFEIREHIFCANYNTEWLHG